MEIEGNVDKQKLKFNESDIGWDVSSDLSKFKELKPEITTEQYSIYNKDNEKILIINNLPKFSKSEKGLYIAILDYLKDMPILDIEKDIVIHLKKYCEENKIILEREQVKKTTELLYYEMKKFGPLTFLLSDYDTIEEIAIIGIGLENPVYVYIARMGWLKTNLFFTDAEYMREQINRMSRDIGRRLTLSQPILNSALPDGSRISAVIPPVTSKYPAFTLRRYKYNPLTPIDLVEYNTMSKEMATFLWMFFQTDSSMLICGNTGSGKTTTLNALFSFVPKTERIVIVEETPEINIPHQHKLNLKIDSNVGINMNDLINSTLRMRPDRLIVGEIRTVDEMGSFVNTLLAGQGKGSFATFHALSSKDAIQRLEKLGMQEMDVDALDLILVQRRWTVCDLKKKQRYEIRKIVSISEIDNEKCNDLFVYDNKTDSWKMNISKRIKRNVENVFHEDYEIIQKEFSKKFDILLKSNAKKRFGLDDLFKEINVV